jgi:glycosyltransferase involved in cell wall biosynthesis
MKKILMLVDKPFLGDVRVRQEAYSLVERGYKITVLCLQDNAPVSRQVVRGVAIYTFPRLSNMVRTKRGSAMKLLRIFSWARSVFGYLVEYGYFGFLCFFLLPMIAVRDGFDAIHINNPPAFLCVACSLYKALGKIIIFDHHDLEPELYISRFRVRRNALYRILLAIETASLRIADMVLATNESYKRIDIQRGRIDPGKVFVVRNAPQGMERPPRPAAVPRREKLSLVYVGIMGPQDGVDYLLRALHHLWFDLGRRDFHATIIGEGDAVTELKQMRIDLGLQEAVTFTGFIPKAELLRRLADADICLDPNPSSPLNDHSTWIKVMEYMAYAKPLVSFDLTETRFTAQDAALYAPPNDTSAFARALATLMDDPRRRQRMGERGYERVTTVLSWERSSAVLIRAYSYAFTRRRKKVLKRIYYGLKPFLPRPMQIALRGKRARWIRRTSRGRWPIDPDSGRPPEDWQGWPEGKRFAVVLTHDVEGTRGVRRCLRVAGIESSFGMTSSFNFVPEVYPVDARLRRHLAGAGFEIGVHGLNHDSKLFSSRALFNHRADRINGYLRAWGAVGFRSPAMFHNLDWIKDLSVEYDCSTFDTDPFEPQPDGIGSIFPLWVPRGADGDGFVELPYTLSQDMTLFVLLQEPDIRIWKEKLDWIADKGGMALLDTHPDYMWSEGERRQVDEYPATHYRDFLRYITEKYGDEFWHALPRDVARFHRSRRASRRRVMKGA